MADDQDFEEWDDEFLVKAIQATEEATASSSSSNPTQQPLSYHHHHLPPPPAPLQQFPKPPQQPLPHSATPISYSPPRQLSQRVKEDDSRHFSKKGFDWQESLNGFNRSLNNNGSPFVQSSRLADEDKNSKEQEIDRLKKELGRVSKELTNLEQECFELRKERDNKEKQLRSVFSQNGSKDAEAACPKKPNLSNKVAIEDHTIIRPGCEGIIPCKAIGVQTDTHAESIGLTIEKDFSATYPSKKLVEIWKPLSDQYSGRNLVTKLFVACERDFRVLFGCLGLDIPFSKKMDSSKPEFSYNTDLDHNIQAIDSTEAAKVSHLYFILTKISYDIARLEALLEALVDLCSLKNIMIVHRSLCVLRVVLNHVFSMEKKLSRRDNVMVEDHSSVNNGPDYHSEMEHLFCENTDETSSLHHPVFTRLLDAEKVCNKDSLSDDSLLWASCSKWVSIFQLMLQIVTRYNEEDIRLEAVSIINIILLRTDAYAEREKYGQALVFQSIPQLLRKEAGLGVQKQAVHLLYLLLNCPTSMALFCSSCKEEGLTAEVLLTTNVKVGPVFQGSSAILDGLVDCFASRGNATQTVLVLKLRRSAVILLAFLASSGRFGFEILLGHTLMRRANCLYLILQVLASEIDAEASESIQPSEVFRERTLLMREALILLNRLASNPHYSTPVLRILTNRREMACLTVAIANRLSRKGKWLWQSDTITRQMRESEIVDLARSFKKRVFTFLGDTTSEK